MKPFFDRWTEVRRKLHPLKDVLWLFDYDGTLTPIVSHPDRAVMKNSVRSLLIKLLRRFPGRVGILSGRSLENVHRIVDMPGLIYGGAHGFKLQGPGITFKRTTPAGQIQRLRALDHDLRFDFRDVPGAWIEDKGWMLAIHYREVGPAHQPRMKAVLESVRAVAKWKKFKIQEGLKVMEVFADSGWDKGHAVQWLKRKLKARRVFYIGDDTTDESVFRVLRPSDVSIYIGTNGSASARYRLVRQQDVIQVLRRVIPL